MATQEAAQSVQRSFRSGWIYFIQVGRDGPIKIGWSADVARRFHQLQSGNPDGLRLVAVRPGGLDKEAWYHRRFDRDRLRGEWFEPSFALEMEITKLSERHDMPNLDNCEVMFVGPVLGFTKRRALRKAGLL